MVEDDLDERAAVLEAENVELRAENERLRAKVRRGLLTTHDVGLPTVAVEAPRKMPVVTTNAPAKGGLIQTHGRPAPDLDERGREVLREAIAERKARAAAKAVPRPKAVKRNEPA
jgi:hypothetical protein